MRYYRLILCILLGILSSCQKESTALPSSRFLAWGFSIDGFPVTESQLKELEEETQIAAQIIQFYLQWPVTANHFDSILPSLETIFNRGAIPCMTWEPMIILKEGKEKAIPYQLILEGHYDPYLNWMTQEIKKWNRPLIIRFAQEMNLKRYHWGTSEEEYGPQSPEIYIKIFRYVVDLFRQQQVKNVLWAFSPNVDSDPNESWNEVKNYYPGDAYVDLLGMDGYNWDITQDIANKRQLNWEKPWLSFKNLFSKLYEDLRAISPHKPILVFEVSTVNRGNEKKWQWIKEALETAKNWKLAAIIWFQAKKEEDWRIQANGDGSYLPIVREEISSFHNWILQKLKDENQIDFK